MTFTSLAFYAFLPIVFAGYWLICPPSGAAAATPRRVWLQNAFVVAASYVFYGWWDWRFLALITVTILLSWACGLMLGRLDGPRARKAVVAVALVVNLGILAGFKYFNFFVDSAATLLSAMGFEPHLPSLRIILPVGISFYTFQALSYAIDVFRKRVEPTRDVVAFAAFVSFFPQLVAGPIERSVNLLPQFLAPRRFDYAQAVDGCRQMLWGFFKKTVVADGCALAANNLLSDATPSSSAVLFGLLCFSFQIYGDFSGYSDIACGMSRLFGISLSRNFAYPYFSRNIGEFWRRWHISLTTWFKDYLYIPLGGSREGLARTIRNTFIVFAVSGLWHGANWTFLAWGLVHAVAFMPLLLAGRNRRFAGTTVAEGRLLPDLRETLAMVSTFTVVMVGWAFFRADTITQACQWLHSLFLGFDFSLPSGSTHALQRALGWIAAMLVCEWVNRSKPYGFAIYPKNRVLRRAAYLAILVLMLLNLSARQTFIYFQF